MPTDRHIVHTIEEYLDRKGKFSLLLTALTLDLLIGYGDFLAGYEVHLNIFYLIPILLTARFVGKRFGIAMTFICTSTITVAYLMGGEFKFHHWHNILWNVSLIEGFFLIITLLSVRIKEDIEERKKMILELQNVLANVKTLSGLLPMCASCKKIRDDRGYWTQVETYISTHTDADFTHGLCPECAKKLYPEYYEALMGKEETESKE